MHRLTKEATAVHSGVSVVTRLVSEYKESGNISLQGGDIQGLKKDAHTILNVLRS